MELSTLKDMQLPEHIDREVNNAVTATLEKEAVMAKRESISSLKIKWLC